MVFLGKAWPAAQHFCVIVLRFKRKKLIFLERILTDQPTQISSPPPSSLFLQTLNPPCAFDQELEDFPVRDRGKYLGVVGRTTFVTARRLCGHRAEAGGGQANG